MFKKIICAEILCLMFCVLPVRASDTTGEGIKAFRAGDYARAEQLYRQALTEETDSANLAAIYRNLSLLYKTQGQDGSEFERKANELDPPAATHRIDSRDGNTMLLYKRGEHSTSSNGSAATNGSAANAVANQDSADANTQLNRTSPAGNSPGLFNSFRMSSQSSVSGLGGSFSAGPGRFRFGGAVGGGRSNFSSMSGMPGGTVGPGYFSSQTPDSRFDYSNSSLIVLPTPTGGAFFLNAPGPNIYSQQQSQDGSNVTIMNRTY